MNQLQCFVVNLKRDSEKRNKIVKYLDNLNLDYSFIEAVEGRDLTDAEIAENVDSEKAFARLGRHLSKGEIGCALSHLSIYKKIVDEKIEVSLILEDDVKVDYPEAAAHIEAISHILEDQLETVDCILLGHHPRYSRELETVTSVFERIKINKRVRLGWFTERPVGAYAYLLTLEGAQKRLREFEMITKPLDHWDLNLLNTMGVKSSIFKVNFELASNLDKERAKFVYERTKFEKIKDTIRMELEKIKLDVFVFRLRSVPSCLTFGIKSKR